MRRLPLLPLLLAAVLPGTAHAGVTVLPSAATVHASGPLPPAGAKSVVLAAASGEQEDAVVVVTGAGRVSVSAPPSIGPLPLRLFFGHYVAFGSRLVPDALLPWNGGERASEQPNQPLWLQVTVPAGTAIDPKSGAVTVVADGRPASVPVSVQVFGVGVPPPNQVEGNLMTAFHLSAQTYGSTVGRLFGLTRSTDLQGLHPGLYAFLASYRISPNSWGFGAPTARSGYTHDRRWWLSSADNMVSEVRDRAFAAMSIPISSNRTSPRNYIAGLSPYQPEAWCDYLRSVHAFWHELGWDGSFPYLYAMDEPGVAGFRMVARQARVAHSCFPGAYTIVTGNP